MNILDSFAKVKILVVGDVMLDRYCWGTVSRISPEAPVPIVSLDKTTLAAGGAANVAANIAGLGAAATLVSVTGDDDESLLLPAVLRNAGVADFFLQPVKGRKTTLKTRVIANHQQVVRLDSETVDDVSQAGVDELLARLEHFVKMADAVVVSDYAKGLLTEAFLAGLITLANKNDKAVLIDPKGKDYTKYRSATMLTPNEREAADACGLEDRTIGRLEESCSRLAADLGLKALVVTRGEKGMMILQEGASVTHLPASTRKVYDVTGAGDTVIATMAVALASGMTLVESAELANIAAGIVIETVGTTAINSAMLEPHLREFFAAGNAK